MKLGARECLWYSNVWIQYMSGEPSNSEACEKILLFKIIKVKIFEICIRLMKFGVRLVLVFRNIYVNS